MTITHPPILEVTLGMRQHRVKTSTFSPIEPWVNVGGFQRCTDPHKDRVQDPKAMARRSRPGVSMPLRVRVNDFLQRTSSNVGTLMDGTVTVGLVAFHSQMGRHTILVSEQEPNMNNKGR